MHKEIRERLICPSCHGPLSWSIEKESQRRILEATCLCDKCQSQYEVRDGIGMFLTPDLVRNDLWAKGESSLVKHFKQHPEVLKKLEARPPAQLNGADLWYLASYYEMQGQYELSETLFDQAFPKIYCQEYLTAWATCRDYILQQVDQEKPVVDLASGKGYLVKELLRKTRGLVVATDFSPTVLLRNKAYYEYLGVYDQLTLLAFDARRMPFASNSINQLTTNLGLSNIEEAGNIAKEIHRVSGGDLFFYFEFVDEADQDHVAFFEGLKMQDMNLKSRCSKVFSAAGFVLDWPVEINMMKLPTPKGEILPGAGIDGVPLYPVRFTLSILHGKK